MLRVDVCMLYQSSHISQPGRCIFDTDMTAPESANVSLLYEFLPIKRVRRLANLIKKERKWHTTVNLHNLSSIDIYIFVRNFVKLFLSGRKSTAYTKGYIYMYMYTYIWYIYMLRLHTFIIYMLRLKMSAKCQPFCADLNILITWSGFPETWM